MTAITKMLKALSFRAYSQPPLLRARLFFIAAVVTLVISACGVEKRRQPFFGAHDEFALPLLNCSPKKQAARVQNASILKTIFLLFDWRCEDASSLKQPTRLK